MDIVEYNPYKPFVPMNADKIIIGNFPIGKFTNPQRHHEKKENEIEFYYGGVTNKLWRLIGECFNLKLDSVRSIKSFLTEHHIAIADILLSCRRKNGSALDSALYDKTYNHELEKIIRKKNFSELIFTSKHVYQEFRKHIGKFPEIPHTILYSPSPNAVRGLVKNQEFLSMKRKDPDFSVNDYRLLKYKQVFS
ncbi:MAG: hypothetical protein H7177_00820 [Rhizobacter sp.]|nr:hypothetical protein [Bacteriovorax sp.]